MEMRAHAHPALMSGLKKLKTYENFIAGHSPTVKRSGLFFFDSHDLSRPEIFQYRNRLSENYSPPEADMVLLLVPQTHSKPFHKAKEFQKIKQVLKGLNPELSRNIHVCFYAAPFGVVPLELDEVYPLSQNEVALPLDKETTNYVAEQVADYVKRSEYAEIVLLHDPANWNNTIKKALKRICCAKQLSFQHLNLNVKRQKTILTRLDIRRKKKPSE